MRTVRNLAIRGALLASATAFIAILAPEAALAQDTAAQADSAPEENIVVIGTRRTDRTVADSASPIDVISAVAPVLSLLPDAVLEAVSGSVIASDVQASNVPIFPGDTYIAGAKVLRQYGIGPLPGVAMMVVLVSRGGFATITSRYDRAAIAHPDLWAQCLREGFDEVLALAGDPPPRVVPVSFPDEQDERPRYKNGSVAYS
jgi:diacylglycerol O-acyltransferase